MIGLPLLFLFFGLLLLTIAIVAGGAEKEREHEIELLTERIIARYHEQALLERMEEE